MKAVLPNVWRSLGDSKDGLFLVENEAFYPVRAKVWPDFHFLLGEGALRAKPVPRSGKE
jgi:hypothetical protein